MTPLAIKTDKNTEKFLMLITATEGTDKNGLPYNVLFGYGTFQGYEKHPEKRIYFTNQYCNLRLALQSSFCAYYFA